MSARRMLPTYHNWKDRSVVNMKSTGIFWPKVSGVVVKCIIAISANDDQFPRQRYRVDATWGKAES